MSSFLTPLRLEFLDDQRFRLTEPFSFVSAIAGFTIIVPAGFVTDFASVPRVLWNILPPTGPYGKAAVIHDYLYQNAGTMDRATADKVLLEGMNALHVGRATRWAVYSGVRVGGWLTWNRYREAAHGPAVR